MIISQDGKCAICRTDKKFYKSMSDYAKKQYREFYNIEKFKKTLYGKL